jgi:hypothetical protein
MRPVEAEKARVLSNGQFPDRGLWNPERKGWTVCFLGCSR